MYAAVTPTAHLKPTCTLKYLWDKIHEIPLSITPKTYQLMHAFVQWCTGVCFDDLEQFDSNFDLNVNCYCIFSDYSIQPSSTRKAGIGIGPQNKAKIHQHSYQLQIQVQCRQIALQQTEYVHTPNSPILYQPIILKPQLSQCFMM